MFRRNFLTALAMAIASFGVAEVVLQTAFARDGDQRIALTGASGSGSARFRSRGTRSEFQVEVERVKAKVGAVLIVTVDEKAAGKMSVAAGGTARLELSNERGQVVPNVQGGSVVAIVDADGKVLMSGKF